jgi:hypothetical protein
MDEMEVTFHCTALNPLQNVQMQINVPQTLATQLVTAMQHQASRSEIYILYDHDILSPTLGPLSL